MTTIEALGPDAAEGSDFPRMGEKGGSFPRTPQPSSHTARVASSFAYAKGRPSCCNLCVHVLWVLLEKTD